MSKSGLILIVLVFLLIPVSAMSAVIVSDTVWSGEVSVDQNILVPKGVTLTISPGAMIRVLPSEGTKTDPEYISFLTEITVRGRLVADGRKDSPVTFFSTGNRKSSWAGIIVDGGEAVLRHSTVRDAETGIDVMKGSLHVTDSALINNRYGLTVQGRDAGVAIAASDITDNDYGIFLLNGAEIDAEETVVRDNRKKDRYESGVKEYPPVLKAYSPPETGESRTYEDEVFLGTVVWQGKIAVNGTIRVPENSRLIIMPGTIVEFSKNDTNSDGIGENGLFIQGRIIAKGTKEQPIFFRSAEKQKGLHDWDAINILNSDRAQNLIEYCQIENAYRGMHFHFANVAVNESVLKNNSRAIQFQESIVEISRTHFYDNNSAVWARDSEITFEDNLIYHNYSGINSFRNTVTFSGNSIMNNKRGGLRVREGLPVVERNLIYGNRYGLLVVDSVYGTFSRNLISDNLESGIALRGPVNIEISKNIIQRNGLYGMSIQDSSAVIEGNLISDNGERGIGILSFHGTITGNNISGNGLYNLGIDGGTDISASMNWWGGKNAPDTIYDKEDDPSKGSVHFSPLMEKPAIMTWPLRSVPIDTTWQEAIIIGETTIVEPGINLAILPNARVLFSEGSGLVVKGKIYARGEKDAPVIFSSSDSGKSGMWDEIRLEYANGSIFSNCIIRDATWGLHVHFTELSIDGCSFINNYGGMRFRSGPVEVRHSYFGGNEIGIRSNAGVGHLTDSLITGNRIGVFIKDKGAGFRMRKNNLFANDDFDIRVGDFNDEDVDAIDNWWGGAAPGDKIFDERFEPGIGSVKFEPYADQAFALEVPSGILNGKKIWSRTGDEGDADK